MVRQLHMGLWHRHGETKEARQASRRTAALWQSISSDRRPRSFSPRVTGLRTKCRGPHSAWIIVRTKGLKEISLECVLLESKPRYVGAPGGASTYETELSASTGHVRNALELCNHVATRINSGHEFCGLLLAPEAQRPAPQARWSVAG